MQMPQAQVPVGSARLPGAMRALYPSCGLCCEAAGPGVGQDPGLWSQRCRCQSLQGCAGQPPKPGSGRGHAGIPSPASRRSPRRAASRDEGVRRLKPTDDTDQAAQIAGDLKPEASPPCAHRSCSLVVATVRWGSAAPLAAPSRPTNRASAGNRKTCVDQSVRGMGDELLYPSKGPSGGAGVGQGW